MILNNFAFHFASVIIVVFSTKTLATVVELTESNAKKTLATPRLAFVNFYVDWCPHSQSLTPIIDEAARDIKSEYPESDQLTFAKVNCDTEVEFAKQHGVIKYPTMRLFRYGQSMRQEYRGQRSVAAIKDFLRSQLSDPLIRLAAPLSADQLPLEKRQPAMVGRFHRNDSAALDTFLRVADSLRSDQCALLAVVGETNEPETVVFQLGNDPATQKSLAYIEETALKRLATENCVAFSRELTFENAEAITEDGLPLFVLFYKDDGADIVDKFRALVDKDLKQYADKINFLYGPGALFVRAVRQLGKSLDDLPLIAVDSFQHMYLFPEDARESINHFPNRLVRFVEDLISGKLHTEYHEARDGGKAPERMATEPPASAFRRLAPSKSRYSFSREEL